MSENRKTIGKDKNGVGYALYVQKNIKEGDYFRTTIGEIFKAVASKNGRIYYAFGEHYWVDSAAIANFQENIIDLIEEDDWVNGQHVKEVKNGYAMVGNGIDGFQVWEEDIRTIVTKEQFKSVEYEVK